MAVPWAFGRREFQQESSRWLVLADPMTHSALSTGSAPRGDGSSNIPSVGLAAFLTAVYGLAYLFWERSGFGGRALRDLISNAGFMPLNLLLAALCLLASQRAVLDPGVRRALRLLGIGSLLGAHRERDFRLPRGDAPRQPRRQLGRSLLPDRQHPAAGRPLRLSADPATPPRVVEVRARRRHGADGRRRHDLVLHGAPGCLRPAGPLGRASSSPSPIRSPA